MIITTRQAVNALDIFHRAVAEVMIERGLIRLVDNQPTEEAEPPRPDATRPWPPGGV